jgi:hypothetical protein
MELMDQTRQPQRRPGPFPPAAPDAAAIAAMFPRAAPQKPPVIPPLPWPQIRHRIAKALRPWYFTGAVGVTGLAVHLGDVSPIAIMLAGVPVVLAVAPLARRAVRGRDKTASRRIRAAMYAAAGAVGWITAAAAAGGMDTASGKLTATALAPLGALVAVPYWRYVRNQPIVIDVVTKTADDESRVLDLWRTQLGYRRGDILGMDDLGKPRAAAADGKAPGVRLEQWQRIQGGWKATMVAPAASGFDFRASQLVRAIAQTYRVGEGAINIAVDAEDASLAVLMVQPKMILAEAQIWGGLGAIDLSDGNIAHVTGRYRDGTPLLRRAYTKGWGSPSRLVLGTTGGGKTEDIKQQLTAERWTYDDMPDGTRKGLFFSIVHDSGVKQGRDYADMLDGLGGFGHTREEAHLIIDALLREGTRRYAMTRDYEWVDTKGRTRRGVSSWNPFLHGAILSVVFDEFHELTGDPAFVAKLEKLARLQRGCCIPITMATQMATIGDTGSQAMRDMLASGSTSLFRTTSALNSALTQGNHLGDVDPRTLEPIPGLCFVANGGGMPMKARTSYIPSDDLYDWWHDDQNNLIGYPAELPAETLEAFGPEWADWQRARAAGLPWKRGQVAAKPAAKPDDAKSIQAVLAVLTNADGPVKFNDLVPASGMSTSSCSNALNKLSTEDSPRVRSVEGERGVWELVR